MKYAKLSLLLTCVGLSGCEYIDEILHPNLNEQTVTIDDGFDSAALEMGLSQQMIDDLCQASKNVEVLCTYDIDNDTSEVTLTVEYTTEALTMTIDNATAVNTSTTRFYFPTLDDAGKIVFENSRTYTTAEEYQHQWSQPEGYDQAYLLFPEGSDLVLAMDNISQITEVTSQELNEVTQAMLTNDDFTRTNAAEFVSNASAIEFAALSYQVEQISSAELGDESFATYTQGHQYIFESYSAAMAVVIEQLWM